MFSSVDFVHKVCFLVTFFFLFKRAVVSVHFWSLALCLTIAWIVTCEQII